jgi:ribonuclease VapC
VIVVDTSALMAILLDEPAAGACIACLKTTDNLVISAGTLAEALIVAVGRGVRPEMERLIEALAIEVVAVTPAHARHCADAYQRWGKGSHPAGLNFGDCFAYALARQKDWPLLFVGNDFRQTDLRPAIATAPH